MRQKTKLVPAQSEYPLDAHEGRPAKISLRARPQVLKLQRSDLTEDWLRKDLEMPHFEAA